MLTKRVYLLLFFCFLGLVRNHAQEDNPFVAYDVPAQNLLKYNRFLINPTFSTVREDKSYMNLLHRNQSVQFDDNNQNYFLSYSGRVSDRTGLGLSLYTQRLGALSNYGVLANYAYGVKLNDNSNFTFGANLSYYNSGFDEGRANTVDLDPFLAGFQDQNLLSFQPGFNLSFGKFDIGAFAENLFDYNLKTSSSLTDFRDKTFSGHLQYTHQFQNSSGITEGGRLMPLARARKIGQEQLTLGGSLILDLPKLGWLQAGYDSFYGAAAGIGFNLNRRLSLGYTMEKGLSSNFDNFGVTHEISFAYSFTPTLTEDRVLLEDSLEDLVLNDSIPQNRLASNEELEELKRKLAENNAVIEELMFRQDSLESSRQSDLERRFQMVMRMVRSETNGDRPDLEKRAQQLFLGEEAAILAGNMSRNNSNDGGYQNIKDTKTHVTLADRARNLGLGAETTTQVAGGNALKNNNDQQKNTVQDKNGSKSRMTMEDRARAILLGSENATVPSKSVAENGTTKDAVDQTMVTTREKDALAINSQAQPQTSIQDRIKSRKFRNLPNVKDGYYVVANVYKGTQYLDKFIDKLGQEGISANYIDNPNNGLKYVYLQRFDTWEDAVAAHNSQLNGTYDGNLWIMNVENKYSNEAYASNVNKLKEKSSNYDSEVLRKNVVQKDGVAANDMEAKIYKIDGLGNGYYIIANVFANPRNANRFVKLLNSYGLSASYFINPENQYRYVYLKKHESWNNALISYYSRLNETYNDKMWIMKVTSDLVA